MRWDDAYYQAYSDLLSSEKIAEEEKLIEDIPKYLEILSRRPLLAKDVKELEKYSYIKSAGVRSAADAEAHREKLAELKEQLGGMADKISDAYEKRKSVYEFYSFYESRMKSDYEILLDRARAEIENIRLMEDRKRAEQEKEIDKNINGNDSVRRNVR